MTRTEGGKGGFIHGFWGGDMSECIGEEKMAEEVTGTFPALIGERGKKKKKGLAEG